MELEPVTYQAEGHEFTGWLADGSGGSPAPGVLLIHEGGGLTDHTISRAMRLAGLGYVAFAMDLFGETGAPIERLREIVKELRADNAALRSRCRAALDRLALKSSVDPKRLAAIGYCFGGAAAVELARTGFALACVVGFHAGIIPTPPPADDLAIKGKVMLCHGADDPVVPAEQVHAFCARLTEGGIDWQLHMYGGVGHSFTNPEIDAWNLPGFFYHESADRRSWAAMLALFDEVFG